MLIAFNKLMGWSGRIKVFLVGLIKTLILASVFIASNATSQQVEEPKLAVLYPGSSTPFKRIFNEIIKGIETGRTNVPLIKSINRNSNYSEIDAWYDKTSANVLIGLGPTALDYLTQKSETTPVVFSGMPIKPKAIPGISLITDPIELFQSTQKLKPTLKTVHVLYSSHTTWLVKHASDAVNKTGITLNAQQVDSSETAIDIYTRIIKNIDSSTEAVWLLPDMITANNKSVIPKISKLAWDENVILISSSPFHVEQGALLTMYPNHAQIGILLGKIADDIHSGNEPTSMHLTVSATPTINRRTANHLRIKTTDVFEELLLVN